MRLGWRVSQTRSGTLETHIKKLDRYPWQQQHTNYKHLSLLIWEHLTEWRRVGAVYFLTNLLSYSELWIHQRRRSEDGPAHLWPVQLTLASSCLQISSWGFIQNKNKQGWVTEDFSDCSRLGLCLCTAWLNQIFTAFYIFEINVTYSFLICHRSESVSSPISYCVRNNEW